MVALAKPPIIFDRSTFRSSLRVLHYPERLPKKSVFTKRYALFRNLLIDARRRAELTQRDIAKSAGRVPSFIANIETGERRLDVIEFLDYCRLLNVDPRELLDQLQAQTEQSVFTAKRPAKRRK